MFANFYTSHIAFIISLPLQLVCNRSDNNRVVGFHYLGPNAGEVTQGYAVAIKMGATKEHFDDTIGIHPTTR